LRDEVKTYVKIGQIMHYTRRPMLAMLAAVLAPAAGGSHALADKTKHGPETQRFFHSEPVYTGSEASTRPDDAVHKVRHSRTGAAMAYQRAVPSSDATGVLTYTATLPSQ
jgi:hypothetical protein